MAPLIRLCGRLNHPLNILSNTSIESVILWQLANLASCEFELPSTKFRSRCIQLCRDLSYFSIELFFRQPGAQNFEQFKLFHFTAYAPISRQFGLERDRLLAKTLKAINSLTSFFGRKSFEKAMSSPILKLCLHNAQFMTLNGFVVIHF